MDSREVAGRTAGQLNVGSYAGQRYPERPEWVELNGVRIDVTGVVRAWREEARLGFDVKLSDATRLLLYYDPNNDVWSGKRKHD
jgi:hypothetical protein